MEDYNELSSPYIAPFLDRNSKDGKEMLKALHEHENHQAPLPPAKAAVEGKTLAYSSMKEKQFYGRR